MPNLFSLLRGRSNEVARYDISQYLRDLSSSYFNFPGMSSGSPYGRKAEDVENSFVGYVNGAYKRNGVIFAIILSRLLLFTEARFMYRRFRDDGTPGELFTEPGLQLLRKPWPNGTTGELLARMEQDVSLAGNFYCVNEGDRLRRLRPDWVSIILSAPPEEAIESDVIGYLYHPNGYGNGIERAYLPDEVCHFSPIPDPIAQYRGMSWLTPVVEEVQADMGATTHKLNFFRNGATPQVIATLPREMTRQQFVEFREATNSAITGISNAYKIWYLGGGADAKVVGTDFRQLDFKVTQGGGETRLCAAGGVPPIIVGLSEGLSSATYSNYGMARRKFGDHWARPQWRMASAALASLVGEPENSELWYDDRDIAFLREDAQDQANISSTLMSTIASGITAGFEPDEVVKYVNPSWVGMKHTGLTSVQLLPPGAQDSDGDGAVDDFAPPEDFEAPDFGALRADLWLVDDEIIDRAVLDLFPEDEDDESETDQDDEESRADFDDDEDEIERRYDVRVSAGHVGGGRFRKLSDQMVALLQTWSKGDGPDDPLDEFSRDQLLKTVTELRKKATADGDHDGAKRLTPRRGASSEELKLALYTDVRASVRGARNRERPSAKFTLSDDRDVAVYRDKDGKPALYQETDAGRRAKNPIARFDSLDELQAWADERGESRLSEWAAGESKPAKVAKVAKKAAPAKKTVPPAVAPTSAIADAIRQGGGEGEIVRLLDAHTDLTPPRLRELAADLGIDVPADARSRSRLQSHIAAAASRRFGVGDGRLADRAPKPGADTRFDTTKAAERMTSVDVGGDIAEAQQRVVDELQSVTSVANLRKVATAVNMPLPDRKFTAAELRQHIAENVVRDRTRWALEGTDPRKRTTHAAPSPSLPEEGGGGAAKAAKKAVPRKTAAPSPTGAEGLSTDPAVRAVQVENRIRQAYNDRAEGQRFVGLAELRESIGEDVPRAEVDAALERLAREPGVGVRPSDMGSTMPWTAHTGKWGPLRQQDRDAALLMGGTPRHMIDFANPAGGGTMADATSYKTPLRPLPSPSVRKVAGDAKPDTGKAVPGKKAAPKAAKLGRDEAVAALGSATTRDDARAALDGLTVAELKAVATQSGAYIGDLSAKESIKTRIVEHTVGFRLNSQTIRDGSWSSDADPSAAPNPDGLDSTGAPGFDLQKAMRQQGISEAEIAEMREQIRIGRPPLIVGKEGDDDVERFLIAGMSPEVRRFYEEHRAIYNHLVQEQMIPRGWTDQWAGATPAAQAAATKAVRAAVAPGTNPIVVRRRSEASIRDMLDRRRMRTQFETGTSAGFADTQLRADFEQMAFGLPQDLPAERRPVYGYVAVGGLGRDNGEKLSQYGDIRVVLRDSIRPRTTASVGDSLDRRKVLKPMPIDEIDWHAVQPGQAHTDYDSDAFREGNYVETQIQGGVKTSDIAEIVFPRQPEPDTVAALQRAGVSWRIGTGSDGLDSLEGPLHPPLSTDPAARAVQVENRIRAAVEALQSRPGGPVALAALRASVGDVPRAEVDAALRRLGVGGANLFPESNQKTLTQRDRDASLRLGNQDKHLIMLDDTTPRPVPESSQARLDQQRGVANTVALIHADLANEGSDRAITAKITSASRVNDLPDTQRDRLLDAFNTGGRDSLDAALTDLEQEHGLTRIGNTGDVVPYDPAVHQGTGLRPGQPVLVIRPGHTGQTDDGGPITVDRATVVADDED